MVDEVIDQKRRAFLGTSALILSGAAVGGEPLSRSPGYSTRSDGH